MISVNGIAKKPITDATAVPYVVQQGYVFYNNNGRQVGTYPASRCIHEKTISASKGTDTSPLNLDCKLYMLGNGIMRTYYDDSYKINLDTITGCYLMNELSGKAGPVSESNLKSVCSESVYIPLDSIIEIRVTVENITKKYIIGNACLDLSYGNSAYLSGENGLIAISDIALHTYNNYVTDIFITSTYAYTKYNVSATILYYNK